MSKLFKRFTFHTRLILFLFFSCMIILGFSSSTAKATSDGTWKRNDEITSAVVCLSMETILEVARQDSINVNNAITFIRSMLYEGKCISFSKPTKFIIDEVILQYNDFLNKSSTVLRVNYPYSDNNPFGFVIALQKSSI